MFVQPKYCSLLEKIFTAFVQSLIKTPKKALLKNVALNLKTFVTGCLLPGEILEAARGSDASPSPQGFDSLPTHILRYQFLAD